MLFNILQINIRRSNSDQRKSCVVSQELLIKLLQKCEVIGTASRSAVQLLVETYTTCLSVTRLRHSNLILLQMS